MPRNPKNPRRKMVCIACGHDQLEREDCSAPEGKGTPAALYRCEDCDTLFMWIKEEGLRLVHEGPEPIYERRRDYSRAALREAFNLIDYDTCN